MTLPILHHCEGARSFRCLWAAEEAGFDLDLRQWPFPPRVFAKEFKDVNPLGTIPAWEENGHLLTESAAICQYLADKVGALRVLPGDPRYGDYLNFLHQSDATLTFPQTLVLRYTLLEKPENRNPKVASDYRRWFIARTTWAERALSDGRPWLCGDEFTVADIAVAYALLLAGNLGHLGEVGPHLLSYWDRCQARDGFQRAKAAQKA